MSKQGYAEEPPLDAPPPYSETPQTQPVSSSSYQRQLPPPPAGKPPSHPNYNNEKPPLGRPPASLNTSASTGSSSASSSHTQSWKPSSQAQPEVLDIYLNNLQLPFQYPAGYLCSKCKNTGYKKNGNKCLKCWEKFYLNKHAYNPNPALPFKYPVRFLCEKCDNTGYKKKNGLLCKDCWERFGPRNRPSAVQTSFSPFDLFGTTTTTTTMVPSPYGVSGPPMRVTPGDPRLGGVLCGRCRGSGIVHFLLDEEMCPVCCGLGRIVNQQQQGPPPGMAPMNQPYPQQGYYPPQPNGYGGYRKY